MIRTVHRLCIAVFFVAVLASSGFAWNDVGHKIVAYIAWERMTPEVRERVVKILRSAPEDSQIAAFYRSYGSQSKEAREREFFMEIASWADVIKDKDLPVRYQKYSRSDWHYSDTFWKYDKGKAVLVGDLEPNGHAMEKIVEFDKLIRGTASDSEKAIAIAWLEHLIGDIHQPLHMSARVTYYDPKGDQGGNRFLLTPKGTPRDEQKNLHSFWDSIVESIMPNTADQCDTDYMDPIGDKIMAAYPYDKEKGIVKDGDFLAWGNESYVIASTEVYDGIDFFKPLSDKYKARAWTIAEERLALAGYRLGDLFNSVFTSAGPVMTQPAKTGAH